MMTDKKVQKHLQLWAKTAPREAVQLPYVDTSHLSFCKTKAGELNLQKKEKKKVRFLHSTDSAAAEAEAWFHALDLRHVSLLCVYGVGLGYYYDAALPWLKKNRKRRLVFLEDDLALIYKLFETERAAKILQNPQVQLIYFKGLDLEKEAAFDQLYWNYALTRFCISALKSYQQEKRSLYAQLHHKICYDAAMRNALVDEFIHYGASFYLNFYPNMLQLPNAFLGTQLFDKFKGVPAIICGAGPSLKKHLGHLEPLLDKALLFAGGSAINALSSAGILPHFGAGIDPNPGQLERVRSHQAYELPFFYRNRLYHPALKEIQGPHLYITGTGGYDTAEYFEKKLGIQHSAFLDEGHNVINFCTQLAQALGCNPILYIGMDLAYTGMQEYAPGIKEGISISKKRILNSDDPEQAALKRKDIYGRPTYTLWKWLAEADWISDFAAAHPNLTLVNCTEGGIGFPGVPNKTLKEATHQYLQRHYKLRSRIDAEIQKSRMPQVTPRKVRHLMRELQKSLQRCEEDLQVLIEELETAKAKIEKGEKEIIQSGRSVLAETDLAEEPAYTYVLEVFNELYARLLSGETHEMHIRRYTPKQRLLKRLELTKRSYTFLRDTAKVNRELIAHTLA